MKSNAEVILEMKVGDILLSLINQIVEDGLYNEMDTGDLQSYCQVKAMDIIKMAREAK